MANNHNAVIETYFLDVGVDHKKIAHYVDEAIFLAFSEEGGYDDAHDFLENEQERQDDIHPNATLRLKQIALMFEGISDDSIDGWQAFFGGGIVAFALLDEIANERGIEQDEYRRVWLDMKHVKDQGMIDFVQQVDELILQHASEEYINVAIKIADEISSDDQEHDDFIEAFEVIMATGKRAMTKLLLSRVSIAASDIVKETDFNELLKKLVTKDILPGYEYDAAFEYKWIQRMFEKYMADYDGVDQENANAFTEYITAIILGREDLQQALSPPEGTEVVLSGMGTIMEFFDDETRDRPDNRAEVLFLSKNDFIEGVFHSLASVTYHPKPGIAIETYDPSTDLTFGPAVCLSNATVVDAEGYRHELAPNTIALIPTDNSKLTAYYRLPKD